MKFSNGFFDLKKDTFIAGQTEINLQKDSFDNEENDPRLTGVSSSSKNQVTTLIRVFLLVVKNETANVHLGV